MKPNEYQCAICGGVFEEVWDDVEADLEYLRYFGTTPEAGRKLVCEDCYQKFKPEAQPEMYAEYLAKQAAKNIQN
jgi:hypothetical protein